MKYGRVTSRRRQNQGGFILLVIFLMAAVIAFMLYQQLPRIAFESERDKEQLLVERGEQYERGIQMYYRANNGQLPQTVDDLERGTNNVRYLRKRYIDPYTGKDEWRLIHRDGNGNLTDSLVTPPPLDSSGQSSSQSTTGALTVDPNAPTQNLQVMARPSDVTLPGAESFNAPNPQGYVPTPGVAIGPNGQPVPGTPPLGPNGLPVIPGVPQLGPDGQPLTQPGRGGFGTPGQGLPVGVPLPGNVQTQFATQNPNLPPGFMYGPNNTIVPITAGANPNAANPAAQANANLPAGFTYGPNNTIVPITQGGPGAQPNPNLPPGFTYGPNNTIVPITAGTNPNAANPGGSPNGALPPGYAYGPNNTIVLANPAGAPVGIDPLTGKPLTGNNVPVGLNTASNVGLPNGAGGGSAIAAINQQLTTPQQAPNTSSSFGGSNSTGGLVGVASLHQGPSIAIYNDRQKYQEWEFLCTDKCTGGGGGAVGGVGGAAGGRGGPGAGGRGGPGGAGGAGGRGGGAGGRGGGAGGGPGGGGRGGGGGGRGGGGGFGAGAGGGFGAGGGGGFGAGGGGGFGGGGGGAGGGGGFGGGGGGAGGGGGFGR